MSKKKQKGALQSGGQTGAPGQGSLTSGVFSIVSLCPSVLWSSLSTPEVAQGGLFPGISKGFLRSHPRS